MKGMRRVIIGLLVCIMDSLRGMGDKYFVASKMPATAVTESWKLASNNTCGLNAIMNVAAEARLFMGFLPRPAMRAKLKMVSINAERTTEDGIPTRTTYVRVRLYIMPVAYQRRE